MNSAFTGQTWIVPNVKSRDSSRSGFFVVFLLFLGGCLIGVPYYATIESGSLTPTGMAGWIVIAVASWLGRAKRIRWHNDLVIGLIILFFLWTWFSFFFNCLTDLDMLPAFTSNLKTYYLLSFIIVGLLLAGGRADSFSWVFQGVKWINFLVCLAIWYLYFTSGIFTTWDLWTGRVLGREFMPGWGTQVSALLVLGLGLSLCDFLQYHKKRRKLFELGLMAAFAFTILIAINRSSWLMGIAFGLVVLWIIRPRKVTVHQVRTLIRMGLALLLLAAIIGLALGLEEGLLTALIDRVFYFQVFEQSGIIDDRLNFWPVVVGLIWDSPIFGYGGMGSNYISNVDNPHSDYFDILIRYGIPGLLILYSLIFIHASRSIRLARALWKTFDHYRYLLILGPFALSCFVYGLFQYSFRDNVIGALIYLMIGYVLGLWWRRHKLLTNASVLVSR
jgi:O-antigen ligase